MNSPYHIITISAIVFLSYAITWVLSYLTIVPKVFHRRFWNTLLLISFLLTAILGFILTLQVNLKIELSGLDSYMVWHVDAGISLAIISIFHIYWHWKYYLNLFNPQSKSIDKESNAEKIETKPIQSSTNTKWFAFLLGLNTLVIQTVFLREFMVMFEGNEFTIGTIIFFWMLFTGLGATASNNKLNIKRWDIVLIIHILLSGLLIAISNTLRFKLFFPGEEINLLQIFWFSASILLPICFYSGFLFPKLFFQYQKSVEKKFNVIYSIETLGSVIGGIVFTFILGIYFRSIEIMGILLLLNSIFFFIINSQKFAAKTTYFTISILIIIASGIFHIDKKIKQPLFPNQEIISYHPSPFGDIAITQQYEQQNYYQNTEMLFNNQDIIATEELVHFSMLQLEYPKQVLILGGNFDALIAEIEKYNISQIDFVESNPILFKKWKDSFSPDSSKTNINLINNDFRKYLKQSEIKYDVILLNLPAPESLHSNRFYTIEFFKILVRRISEESGVLCFNLPPVYNYINDEQVNLFSTLYNTVNKHFKNIEFLVSENTYLIASNKNIKLNLGELADEVRLDNEFVNSSYVDSWSIIQRNEDIKQRLIIDANINHDLKPIIFKSAIKNWLNKSQINVVYHIMFIMLSSFILISFLINKKPQASLLLAGFSTSSIEIILIYLFQILFGNIYLFIGLIISIFMLGITLGASHRFSSIFKFNPKNLRIAQLAIISSPIFILLTLNILNTGIILFVLISILAFLIPILTGWIFSYTTQIKTPSKNKSPGYNYFIDLLGSAIGILLISIYILPQVGLIASLLIISGVNVLGLAKKSN